MALTVRLNPKTERALNAMAKRRRLSRSDVVREAIAQYSAGESGNTAGRPYDAWLDVLGVVRLGARESERTTGVLVDAGPLVALIDRADPEHEACVEALKAQRGHLLTVWPAFTEAMYLLRGSWRAQQALWSRLETDALALAPLDETDAPRMRELMEKYRDLPMDLADAALVRVAERDALTHVFTLDRTLFSVYRAGRRRLVIEPA